MEKHHYRTVTLINRNTVYKEALTWPTYGKGGLRKRQAGLPELGYGEGASPALLVLRFMAA